ncbi:MAG: hypothetical protein OXK80_00150 [Bdellovibrionales bacterium]|nr:hypothetical protein [Bdellovibrionales bacterium]
MRPSTFKILLAISFYPLAGYAQPLSKAEHCVAVEEKLDIDPSALHDTYVTVYLNHLQQCQPAIDRQFFLYKKLLDQLLKAIPSTSSMEAIDRVVHTMLDEIPNPNLDSLSEIAHEPWKELSKRIQTDRNIVPNIAPSVNYYLEKPLSVSQNIQTLRGVPLRAVEMTQNFSSQFSICTNTEEFQHLLKPLHYFLQDLIFLFARFIDYNQMYSFQRLYRIYHTLHMQQNEAPSHLQFISWLQLPLHFIEFLSESVDWTAPPFQNNYKWLEPLLTLLTLHKQIGEKMQNYCVPYQPFLTTQFVEHHYIAQFLEDHEISEERRGELLEIIQENLKERDHGFFFRSTIPADKERIYLYFLRLHSTPE